MQQYITKIVKPASTESKVLAPNTYYDALDVKANDEPIVLFNPSKGSEQVSDVQPLVLKLRPGETASNQMNSEALEVSNQDYSKFKIRCEYNEWLDNKHIESVKNFINRFKANTSENTIKGDKLDVTETINLDKLDDTMGNIFVKYFKFFTDFFDISVYSHLFYLGFTVLLGFLVVNLFYTKETVKSDNESLNITNVNCMQETQYDNLSSNVDAEGYTDDDLLIDEENISLSDADAEGDTDEDIVMDQNEISPLDSAIKPENYKNLPGFNAVMSAVIKSAADYDSYTQNKNFLKRLLGKNPVINVMANVAAPRVVVAGALNKANYVLRQFSIPLSKAQQVKIDKLKNRGLIDKDNIVTSIEEYINNPSRVYESTVTELCAYLLDHYFEHKLWNKPAENLMHSTKKRPDYMVKGLYKNKYHNHILVELKKHKGASFKQILKQINKSGLAAVGTEGEYSGNEYKFDGPSMFHIIIRGRKIGFLERYNYRCVLDEESVLHYKGIIPLTQKIPSYTGVTENPNLDLLQHAMWSAAEKDDYKDTFPYKDKRINDQNKEQEQSGTYYIFDILDDADIVHELFFYMRSNLPRVHIK